MRAGPPKEVLFTFDKTRADCPACERREKRGRAARWEAAVLSRRFPHSEHIRELKVSASARRPAADENVASWLRCINQPSARSAQACEAYIVPDVELREYRQQSEELITIARSGLENLFRQAAGQERRAAASRIARALRSSFSAIRYSTTICAGQDSILAPNGRNPEQVLARSAHALRPAEALSIHQTDHFDNTHTPLSCTAAPIYDVRGSLSAVLDISLLSSPIKKASHKSRATSGHGDSTAHRIGQSDGAVKPGMGTALRSVAGISRRRSGSGHLHRWIWARHRHDQQRRQDLARSASLDWRQPDDLIGQPISRFFDMEIDDLPDLTRQRSDAGPSRLRPGRQRTFCPCDRAERRRARACKRPP